MRFFSISILILQLAWAPGKGVKGKEWKDYWEVELGVSYIPWNKLTNITDRDLELLEEGGMIDEDTLPPHLKGIFIFLLNLYVHIKSKLIYT